MFSLGELSGCGVATSRLCIGAQAHKRCDDRGKQGDPATGGKDHQERLAHSDSRKGTKASRRISWLDARAIVNPDGAMSGASKPRLAAESAAATELAN